MSGSRGSGFTIIETMLFLAISGSLVVGIMAGAGTAINNQRYKDATNSLVSYVQSQYDRVLNVQNDRGSDILCRPESKSFAVANTPDTHITRGASLDCAILGRLLTLSQSDAKTTIISQAVYGWADTAEGNNDYESIENAGLFVGNDDGEAKDIYTPEWSTTIALAGGGDIDNKGLLIVRSPTTGAIHTFNVSNASGGLSGIATTEYNRAETTWCVNPNGLTMLPIKGVKITKDASGMSGVKMTNEGEC